MRKIKVIKKNAKKVESQVKKASNPFKKKVRKDEKIAKYNFVGLSRERDGVSFIL